MAKYEQLLAAATWTNLTSTLVAACGKHLMVRADGADFKIGRKATAPTDGPVLAAGVAKEVIIKDGDTLVLWAYSTAGGKIYGETAGGATVSLDGTGTT